MTLPSIALERLRDLAPRIQAGTDPTAALHLLEYSFTRAEETMQACPAELSLNAVFDLDKALTAGRPLCAQATGMLDRGNIGHGKLETDQLPVDPRDSAGEDAIRYIKETDKAGLANPLPALRLLACAFVLAGEALRDCPADLIPDAALKLDTALAASLPFRKEALRILDRGNIGRTKQQEIHRHLDNLMILDNEVAMRRSAYAGQEDL